MTPDPRYSMLIRWSEDDQLYLVAFPELGGPDRFQTHGVTYEEAARRGRQAMTSIIEAMRTTGRPMPEPAIVRAAPML